MNLCYPGARVQDINKLLPNILNQHQEIEFIIVHVAFNGIMKSSSAQLDFKELIGSLLDTNKYPIISGPLPSLNCGIEHFSRLSALHNWLRDYRGVTMFVIMMVGPRRNVLRVPHILMKVKLKLIQNKIKNKLTVMTM